MVNVQRLVLSSGYTPITAFTSEHGRTLASYLGPEQLPVSSELQASLAEWAARYDHRVQGEAKLAYDREGWVLANRMARELGGHPPVHWNDLLAVDAPAPR